MRYLGQNFHNLVLYLDYRACLLPFVGGGVGHGCVCVCVVCVKSVLGLGSSFLALAVVQVLLIFIFFCGHSDKILILVNFKNIQWNQ